MVFVTGNQNKVNELKSKFNFEEIDLSSRIVDLLEIQDANVLNIAQEKCRQAYAKINDDQPPDPSIVLIEDVSLNFKALNGMPGPYIKCK